MRIESSLFFFPLCPDLLIANIYPYWFSFSFYYFFSVKTSATVLICDSITNCVDVYESSLKSPSILKLFEKLHTSTQCLVSMSPRRTDRIASCLGQFVETQSSYIVFLLAVQETNLG